MCGRPATAWSGPAREAAERTAELFLEHRLFRALATGEPIRESFVTMHSPPYWHYDFCQALVVLARMGLSHDPRAADALDLKTKMQHAAKSAAV